MKPLDLEKAMAGEETITKCRDWCKVVYVHTNVALVVMKTMHGDIFEYWVYFDGKVNRDSESSHDVYMKPKTKTLWAVVNKESYRTLSNIECYAVGNACEDRDKIINSFSEEEMKTRQLIQFEIEEL